MTREEKLERDRKRSAAYRKAHPKKVRKSKKIWQQANLDKHRVYNERYRKNNPNHNKEYREKNAKAVKQKEDKYRKNFRGRIILLLSQARIRARKAGFIFEEGLYAILEKDIRNCACCGRDLDYSLGRGRNNRDYSPSLDRVRNEEGYTANNTKLICFRCNRKKSDMSQQELECLLAYVRINAA